MYQDDVSNWFSTMARKKTIGAKIRHFAKLPVKSLLNPVISLMEGLKDPFHKVLMGVTAENIADKAGITREEMDAYSVRSHERLHAYDFSDEIVPMFDNNNYYGHDGGVRLDVTVEKLGRMRPAFTRNGTVTAANSSQITDGAAMLILASEEYVRQWGITPLAEIIDIRHDGLEPMDMGLGPVPAIRNLMTDNNIKIEDLDHVEINEAFAGQVLACNKQLGFEEGLLNPHGGAIACGHPIGASLARLALHASLNIKDYSVVAGCIGGGQGSAMLLKGGGV
jgi:acetyl-CoA C-acetyltransferase